MAQLLKCDIAILDGERHFGDDICWCGAVHDEKEDCLLHPLGFNSGKNAPDLDYEA